MAQLHGVVAVLFCLFCVINASVLGWTWVTGNATINQPGRYGDTGNANTPGARERAIGWYDSSSQELWLFGGYGFGQDGSSQGTCPVYFLKEMQVQD